MRRPRITLFLVVLSAPLLVSSNRQHRNGRHSEYARSKGSHGTRRKQIHNNSYNYDFIQKEMNAPPEVAITGRQIAVCFVGQFIRHSEVTANIQKLFGPHHFDAFVATSMQHSELNSSDFVNANAICDNLRHIGGFRSCQSQLEHYNGTEFVSRTLNLGFQNLNNGLYPHRILSFFSSIQRCMLMVSNSSHWDDVGSHSYYSTVVVTRLDVIGGWTALANGALRWNEVDRYDLVVSRRTLTKSKRGRVEDRLFFGQYDIPFLPYLS